MRREVRQATFGKQEEVVPVVHIRLNPSSPNDKGLVAPSLFSFSVSMLPKGNDDTR
jgi:hypothetical protein